MLNDHGFTIIPDFLDAPAIAALQGACLAKWERISDRPATGSAMGCDVIPWDPLAEGAAVFADMAEGPALHGVTSAVLGDGWRPGGALVMFNLPGGRGQSWHQDCPAGEDAEWNLNRLIYPWDADDEAGALLAVPGSHRRGRIPGGEPHGHLAGEERFTPRAGTLVLLHGRCWHRVTGNRTARPRISLNFRAYPAACQGDPTAIGIYRNQAYDFRRDLPVAG